MNKMLSGDTNWTMEDVMQVAHVLADVRIGHDVREQLERGESFLSELLAARVRVYGLTTGFGPLATTLVPPEHRQLLQHQLVAHLATGVGDTMSYELGRAVLFARTLTLSQGYSCAPVSLLELMSATLNAGLSPAIPKYGSVGASGDLTPLAHVARNLMGEGMMWGADQRLGPAHEVLEAAGLSALVLTDREGLALVNGTDAMTGVASMTGARMSVMMQRCLDVAVAYAEVMGAQAEAWDALLGECRRQPGQQWVHEQLQRRLDDGPHRLTPMQGLLELPGDLSMHQALVQDAYSMRCVPQLLGAIKDVMTWHREVVERELLAVTDNPIFDVRQARVVHGGNFYGQHVAFASDALRTALVKMMVWLERVASRLCDADRSRGLPAFLVWRQDKIGLHSGFMGAQVTASALLALARTRTSASSQSVPTNGGNQDVVTMGTIAAMECHDLLERAQELLAIVGMMLAQAMELRDERLSGFSASSRALHAQIRTWSERVEVDRALSDEIQRVARAWTRAPVGASR